MLFSFVNLESTRNEFLVIFVGVKLNKDLSRRTLTSKVIILIQSKIFWEGLLKTNSGNPEGMCVWRIVDEIELFVYSVPSKGTFSLFGLFG